MDKRLGLLSECEWFLAIPMLSGSGNSESGFRMNKGLGLLSEGEWLLSIPMLTSRGDSKSSLGMNKWFLSLSKCQWFLSIPVLSSSRNSEAGLWVNVQLLLCEDWAVNYFLETCARSIQTADLGKDVLSVVVWHLHALVVVGKSGV